MTRAAKAPALLLAVAFAGAAAVLAYAAVRVTERALFPEPNPAILIWSDRSSVVWRSLVALHLGVLGGFGGYALAARAPRAAARWLPAAVAGATAAIVLAAGLAP